MEDGVRLGAWLGRLGYGDHFCCIYEREETQWQVLVPFMKLGLANGDRCILADLDRFSGHALAELARHGVDVARHQTRRALFTIEPSSSRMREHGFDSSEMLAFIGRAESRASEDGFKGRRYISRMTWTLLAGMPPEKLAEFESRLNRFLAHSRTMVACLYHRPSFDLGTLHDALRNHPLLLLEQKPLHNPYYDPAGAPCRLDLGAKRREAGAWLEELSGAPALD